MKIYEALYCDCIYESAFATLSLHKTKAGAEKAVNKHQNEIKLKFKEHKKWAKKEKIPLDYSWDAHQSWSIAETELEE